MTAVFERAERERIEREVAELINSQPDFLALRTAPSTRAAGDAIQHIVAESFGMVLGDLCETYSSSFARRAMADLAFTDQDGLYYVVDVKTHRQNTQFNMPNIISVERIARFYEDANNTFAIMLVRYALDGLKVAVTDVMFRPLEQISWSSLTIGALGWGQIQIANANRVEVDERQSRRDWMMRLCDVMLEFYPREINKITARIEYFNQLRQRWESRPGQ